MWRNVIWCDVMWYNAMQYNTMQCNTIGYDTAQYNAIQFNAMQCNTMQCNVMQCNTIQYNTILHHCSDWGRMQFRVWTHKRHPPYLAPTGELWGVFWEDFEDNWPRYNGIALYIGASPSHNKLSTNSSWGTKLLHYHIPAFSVVTLSKILLGVLD